MKKNRYLLSMSISLILITTFCVFIGIYFILEKEKELLEKKYGDLKDNLTNKVNALIHTKKNATLSIAITLAEN